MPDIEQDINKAENSPSISEDKKLRQKRNLIKLTILLVVGVFLTIGSMLLFDQYLGEILK